MQLDPAGSCRRLMQEARRPRSGPSIALPIALLLLFAIAVGAVNFARWGNSFTFVDFRYYYWGLPARQFSRYPAKLRRNQPRPNVDRGIVLWDGHSIPAEGSASVHRILTQPDCGNRSAAVLAIPDQPAYDFPRRDRSLPPVVEPLASPHALAILRLALVGHTFAVLLILSAMYLTMRYRFDFAPLMTMAALIGYRAISFTAAEKPESWRKRLRIAAVGLCVLGILGSHYGLFIHQVCSVAVPIPVPPPP